MRDGSAAFGRACGDGAPGGLNEMLEIEECRRCEPWSALTCSMIVSRGFAVVRAVEKYASLAGKLSGETGEPEDSTGSGGARPSLGVTVEDDMVTRRCCRSMSCVSRIQSLQRL